MQCVSSRGGNTLSIKGKGVAGDAVSTKVFFFLAQTGRGLQFVSSGRTHSVDVLEQAVLGFRVVRARC